MKIHIYHTTDASGRKLAKARAVISISIKHGILKRRQKTWTICDSHALPSDSEVKAIVIHEARRWQLKTMKKLFGDELPVLEEASFL